MTDPGIVARSGFGVIDHVDARCADGNGDPVEVGPAPKSSELS